MRVFMLAIGAIITIGNVAWCGETKFDEKNFDDKGGAVGISGPMRGAIIAQMPPTATEAFHLRRECKLLADKKVEQLDR